MKYCNMKYCDREIHFDWHADNLPEGPYEYYPFAGLEIPFEDNHLENYPHEDESLRSEPDIRWNE